MNRPFIVLAAAYREESSGQISELVRFAEGLGIKFVSHKELSDIKYNEMTVGQDDAAVPQGALLYIDKKSNADIIKSVRAALTFNADGVIIKFGNNPFRDYIKEDLCYTANELKSAVDELKRLAPLFGRGIRN